MCVMVSCCGGAELQVVRAVRGDEEIVLRELYPDRSSLYERARELQLEQPECEIGLFTDFACEAAKS